MLDRILTFRYICLYTNQAPLGHLFDYSYYDGTENVVCHNELEALSGALSQ
ncbi:TPA: hypothetical protein ACGZ9G_000927 [Elizabethkingia anophelis]